MRKLWVVLLFLAVSSPVMAGQYVTRRDETVRGLTLLLGHTAYQLRAMNPSLPADTEKQLPLGLLIIFISQDDLDCARMHMEKLAEPLSGKEFEPWRRIMDDIQEQGIAGVRFLPNAPGVTYRQVLAYARLWRQAHP